MANEFLMHALAGAAQKARQEAAALQTASMLVNAASESGQALPLQDVARAVLALGFCVVSKDALATAIDVLGTVDTTETDITDDTTLAQYNRTLDHLRAALIGH
jgi:uncharacterized membrane-anchored protein